MYKYLFHCIIIKIRIMAFDPLGSILSVASSVADSVLNFIGVKDTNKTNAGINEQNRVWQSSENALNRDFISKQADIQRLFQSPANQMSLLRDAGLNPYLSQSSAVGSAASPSVTSPGNQGSPASIPMQAPKFNLKDAVPAALNVPFLRSQTDANKARSVNELVDAIPVISQYLGADAARSYLRHHLSELDGADYENSQAYRRVENEIKKQELNNRIVAVEADIQEKYGADKAYQILSNLQFEGAKIHSEIGKIASDAKVNDKNIDYLNQRIDTLIAEKYKEFKLANFYAARTLSEDEMRQLYKSKLLYDAAQGSLDFQDQLADFLETEMVRKYKGSKAAKVNAQYDYGLNNNVATSTLDYLIGRADKVLGSSSRLPDTPWNKYNTVRHRATRPTYNGKESIEWYAPLEP